MSEKSEACVACGVDDPPPLAGCPGCQAPYHRDCLLEQPACVLARCEHPFVERDGEPIDDESFRTLEVKGWQLVSALLGAGGVELLFRKAYETRFVGSFLGFLVVLYFVVLYDLFPRGAIARRQGLTVARRAAFRAALFGVLCGVVLGVGALGEGELLAVLRYTLWAILACAAASAAVGLLIGLRSYQARLHEFLIQSREERE